MIARAIKKSYRLLQMVGLCLCFLQTGYAQEPFALGLSAGEARVHLQAVLVNDSLHFALLMNTLYLPKAVVFTQCNCLEGAALTLPDTVRLEAYYYYGKKKIASTYNPICLIAQVIDSNDSIVAKGMCSPRIDGCIECLKKTYIQNYSWVENKIAKFYFRDTTPPALPFVVKKYKEKLLNPSSASAQAGLVPIYNQTYLYHFNAKQFESLETQALYYLATTYEYKQLLKNNTTVALFFKQIKVFNERLVTLYRKRVAYANEFFTADKPGWATDRGMIYIMFGTPEVIHIYPNREIWYYAQTPGSSAPISFTFLKENFPNYYRLVRRLDYQPVWFEAVSAWRNAKIEP